jgi:hypothetical protein
MKQKSKVLIVALTTLLLGACAASSTSPVGVNCNYNLELPMWEMPLACQGR